MLPVLFGQEIPAFFKLTTDNRGHTLAHCENLNVLGLNADGGAKVTAGVPFRHSQPTYPSWERAAQALVSEEAVRKRTGSAHST
jgi:hypothetical protein